MFIAGTAGHVDHGKSTLIRALTGIDPDRLAQEKSRGMTIELGFAWLRLDNDINLSIVDVPGHEKFVRHMIMGAGGFDIALLVIAADEGIMAQTKEHLAILDLLEVRNGIVVLTKTDAADDELAELVELEVADLLHGTSLQGSQAVHVSALNGSGLSELRSAIMRVAESIEPRVNRDEPRMYVDRSFNIAGFGTVLTGTLDRGQLSIGDEIQLLPSGRRGRVRGLQFHKEESSYVKPGCRVAVNVNGVGHAEVSRGEALVHNGDYSTTSTFDATLRAVSNSPRPIRHNHKVTVYAGTWEEPGTVRMLSRDSLAAGDSGYAQIVTDGKRPLAVADRFVLRDTNDTLGGGTVLVLDAPRHRRNDPEVVLGLSKLVNTDGQESLLHHLDAAGFASLRQIARLSGAVPHLLTRHLNRLCEAGTVVKVSTGADTDALFVTCETLQTVHRKIIDTVDNYHKSYPLRGGMPRQALRSSTGLDAQAFEVSVSLLLDQGKLETFKTSLRVTGFEPVFTPEQEGKAKAFVTMLREDGYSPTSQPDFDGEILAALVARGQVVTAGDVVFEAGIFGEMRDAIVDRCRSDGEVSINDVREMFGTSRKYSLALLEQLDRENVTMRVGDLRKLK